MDIEAEGTPMLERIVALVSTASGCRCGPVDERGEFSGRASSRRPTYFYSGPACIRTRSGV